MSKPYGDLKPVTPKTCRTCRREGEWPGQPCPGCRASVSKLAFTVGYADGYDAALAKPEPVIKVGAGPGYHGGIVWKTPTGAQVYLASHQFVEAFPDRSPEEFAVYRLELATDWETDVAGGHLRNDAVVVERWS